MQVRCCRHRYDLSEHQFDRTMLIHSLAALVGRLRGEGVPVVIYGVNSHQWHARLMGGLLRGAVDFPVYQDQTEGNVWTLLGGRRDDVFVYDK